MNKRTFEITKAMKFTSLTLLFFMSFIFAISSVSAGYLECDSGWNSENYGSYPTGSCTGMNGMVIHQLLGSRLQNGDGCDCSTNKTSPIAQVELFCYNTVQRACEQTFSDSLCVLGCIHKNCQPNWINRQEGSCQSNDQKLISYTDANSCNKNENLPSDAGWQQCNYCSQNIQGPLFSDWTTCSINDKRNKTKYYFDSNYGSCCSITGLSSDCEISTLTFQNTTEEETCDYCTPNLVQVNSTCSVNNTLVSNSSDLNGCYEKTHLDSDKVNPSQILSCDYCTPNWTEVRGDCNVDESVFAWYNDTNSCYEKTGLIEDIQSKPDNKTIIFACDYDKDGFIGNKSDINTTLENLTIDNFNGTLTFNQENQTLFYFDYNLTTNSINLANIFLQKQNSNSSFAYFLIKGLDLSLQNQTKTVYLDRLINGTGICIKDEEMSSISEVSASCNGLNEFWLSCPGVLNRYSCNLTENNTRYMISGLRHSGIKEQSTYCGDSVCNGGESCSSCSSDCGTCPPGTGGSNGGGGGGGGGTSILLNKTNITNLNNTNSINSINKNQTGSNNSSDQGYNSPITGAVIGAGNIKNIGIVVGFILVIFAIAFFVYKKKKNNLDV